jgi:hypothetical protein
VLLSFPTLVLRSVAAANGCILARSASASFVLLSFLKLVLNDCILSCSALASSVLTFSASI